MNSATTRGGKLPTARDVTRPSEACIDSPGKQNSKQKSISPPEKSRQSRERRRHTHEDVETHKNTLAAGVERQAREQLRQCFGVSCG